MQERADITVSNVAKEPVMINTHAADANQRSDLTYQPTARIAALVAMLLRAAQRAPVALGAKRPRAEPAHTAARTDDSLDAASDGVDQASTGEDVGWRYLEAVRGLDRLDTRAELELFSVLRSPLSTADQQQQARDQLIEANLWVVPVIVRRYNRSGCGFDDLVAEGNMGLYKAMDRFDLSRGFRFSTYAKWWVVDAVTSAMANNAFAVRVPRRVALGLSQQRRRNDGRAATSGDIDDAHAANGADVAQDGFHELGTAAAPFDPGATAFVDETREATDPQPDQVVALRENMRHLAAAIRQLPARQRLVIEGRYGLNGRNEMTLQQIGSEIGVTAERVRTLQLAAMAQLRAHMGVDDGHA
jgi:RNA polymerase sigma factor (sigma-70 family)